MFYSRMFTSWRCVWAESIHSAPRAEGTRLGSSTRSFDVFFVWFKFLAGWNACIHLLSLFQDVLDSMWGILRAKYLELSSPFLSQSQQDALLQGMVELISIGKEKLANSPLQHTKSKVALQAQLQDHKVRPSLVTLTSSCSRVCRGNNPSSSLRKT